MNVLIVDDEPLARERLKKYLKEITGYQTVAVASNGKQALQQIHSLPIDIVLLDIRMPGLCGLTVSRHLAALENPPAVIFTTAFNEHALEAFSSYAIAYLLKPIGKEQLENSLKQAAKLTRSQLTGIGTVAPQRQHICLRGHGGLQLIPIRDIYYFKADAKYTRVHHASGQTLIEDPLNRLGEEFDKQFIRVHRNALVAIEQLDILKKNEDGSFCVCLKATDITFEVSRRHLPKVRALFKGDT